jgi:4a-hydroxytetrahydrobiopterin dehydratase
MAIQALSAQEIEAGLAQLPLWRLEGQEIVRTLEFPGFKQAIAYVNGVADQAEKVDHHPDILVQYNKVTLRLSTHDAGGISSRDFSFARAADELFSRA